MRKAALLCLALLALAAGLLAQKVTTEYDENADFAQFKAYAWKQGRIRSLHPAIDNPLVDKRIRGAIDGHLAQRGLRAVPGSAALLVSYSLGTAEKREVETHATGRRLGRTRREVEYLTEGTMVIDLTDAKRNALVWRAVATDTADDPGKLERKLEAFVEKAFQKFPLKKTTSGK